MIEESVHCFGPQDILTGVYATTASARSDLCVVILNSGLLHRVGPYRMFVDLAREIAATGTPVLRFDLSGLGESMVREESHSEQARVVADVRAALDFLEQSFGHQRFALIGLCSGADNAHWAALQDPRIAGAVMMDGPGYINLRYHLTNYVPKLVRFQSWKNFMARTVSTKAAGTPSQQRTELFVRPFPPREQMQSEILQLAQRGTKLLYLYTGGVEYYYNHEAQFAGNFPALKFNRRDSNIEFEYHREFDHTYSNLQHRRYYFSRVLRWIDEAFAKTGSYSAGEAVGARASMI